MYGKYPIQFKASNHNLQITNKFQFPIIKTYLPKLKMTIQL